MPSDAEVGDNRLRNLLQVYDVPPIGAPLRRLVEWAANYYLAPPAAVLRMALSSAAALEGAPTVTEYRLTGKVPDKLTTQRAQAFERIGERQGLIRELATDLADAIKRRWLTKDNSADWERLVRGEQQAARMPKLAPATEGKSSEPPVVLPVNDASPLALRGRFKEQMSLEYASDVLRQIQRQLEVRDDRGRPLLLPRDAKLIADAARDAIAALAVSKKRVPGDDARFTDSPVLRPLIAAGSQLFLGHAVETFDPKQPERFLRVDAIDELLHAECQALLENSLAQPELAAALAALIELDQATARTVEHATTDLFQSGSDRRTLLVVPKDQPSGQAAEKLLSARPLAAVVPAEVDDVLVVSEESGISPRSVALGLEHVFPGIADAARRLHTRIDIEWKALV